jgi:type II restriction/modification system DNA methylase subunit YeeA
MGARARAIIIECGELDWENINPDIFGSMIQAVVNPEDRAENGMHYTSVPNIMKVIQPLFLDDLRGEYVRIESSFNGKRQLYDVGGVSKTEFYNSCKPVANACLNLLKRMSRMKFFDPACGSGNFLIITYKSLRLLEMDILKLEEKCHIANDKLDFIDNSCITLEQFYGIELLDFPHEVAVLSLWLAEHQMDNKFHENFGVNKMALPLRNIRNIKCGNACRLDWNAVCPHEKDDEVYVFGNPPYVGARLQEPSQKEDMEIAEGNELEYNNLDYISCWFVKGANYIKDTNSKLAFVSTNSICQGEQVPLLWGYIASIGIEICFAYKSFKWSNNAKYNAGVTCIIIGLRNKYNSPKYLYESNIKKEVTNINFYLTSGDSFIIHSQSSPISSFPDISFGSMPNDGGYLLLNSVEKDLLIEEDSRSEQLIHKMLGAKEFIRGEQRYCLWITDDLLPLANSIASVRQRIEKCKANRAESKRDSTASLANTPHKFGEIRYKDSDCIIIPRVSSERRRYIPMGYLNAGTVISDSAFAIYDAELWLFGILTSRMHMAWVRTVGGKLKTDYRYSAGICYNTFPFPRISDDKKSEIEEAATNVLLTREDYPKMTLAEMYDPEGMPEDLRDAHAALDDIVDSCYPGYPFANDEARLECLFKLYEKMTEK